MFAGVSNNALIVAGGANFPDKRPWENGTKIWYDKTFVLPKPGASAWLESSPLPRPLGYGISATIPTGVVIAGGSDARTHYRDVFLLRFTGDVLLTTPLPPLPKPCANASAAVVGHTLYVIGGTEAPASTECLNTFWSLDASRPEAGWTSLPPCPGGARMLAVTGSLGNAFYVFSGTSLHAGPDGKPARTYLTDAWAFAPRSGWKRLADVPRAAVAAPSPAPVWDDHLLIVSGDDGLLVNFKPPADHPGFPRNILAYDPSADTWTNFGPSPISRAVSPTATWNQATQIVNGEQRPGVRSPEIWSLSSQN